MKKEYYALICEESVYGDPGFCYIDSDEGNQIGELHETLLKKKELEKEFPEVKYRVVKLVIEEIE